MSAFSIIIAIAALIGGYFFVKKYDAIETSIVGAEDETDGKVFVIWSAGAGALMTLGIILHNMIHFNLPDWIFPYCGGAALVIVFGLSMFDAMFNTATTGRAIGKTVVRFVACLIGAAMGAAVSVIAIGIIILWFLLKVFSGALSSTSSSSSSTPSPQYSNEEEYEIDVPGEAFMRKGKDVGFGKIRDDHGDYWHKNMDGSLEKCD